MKQFYKYIYVCLFVLAAVASIAQPVSKRDKIEALRVSFINQKVNFTTQESQLFWPLYDEYNDKLENARKSFRQQFIKNIDFTTLTDKEAEAYINAELTLSKRNTNYIRSILRNLKKYYR
jgi:hypothetical protein